MISTDFETSLDGVTQRPTRFELTVTCEFAEALIEDLKRQLEAA
jgi:hypothetical protein